MGRSQHKTAVLVPVKPFGMAKSRLADACSASERAMMAKSMLRTVIKAAQGLRVAIIAPTTAHDVRRFALINGARFFAEPEGSGLNGAVQSGVGQLANLGYNRIIIAHSDLPLATDMRWLSDTDGIILVADRTAHGTNAISIPADIGFRFSYGPGSLERHKREAERLGYDAKVIVDPDGLSLDVDDPIDARRAGLLTEESSTATA